MVAGGSDNTGCRLAVHCCRWLSEFGLQLTVMADSCYNSRWLSVDFFPGDFQLAGVSKYSLKVSDSSYYYFVDTRM
jgi:hypothetical protein